MVVRDRPVAWATNDMPPYGRDRASAAAHTRSPRSSSTPEIARYFSRKLASSSLTGEEYTVFFYLFKLFMRKPLVPASEVAAVFRAPPASVHEKGPSWRVAVVIQLLSQTEECMPEENFQDNLLR